jgi:uncharacterized membrane protein YbhN (UPF0104 family)
MVSRERLLRLGTTVAEHATAKRVRVIAQLLLLAALVFVVVRVRSIWHGSRVEVAGVGWPSLVGALLLAGLGLTASGFVWLTILERLGLRTRPRWTAIFFQAQLAKYIPGSLWQYAGRTALSRARGLPTRLVAVSLPIELGASITAGAVMAALLLGAWGIPVVVAALCSCVAAGRRVRQRRLRLSRELSAAAAVVPPFVAIWLVLGSSFWLTAHALLAVPASQFLFYIGAFTASWVVGVVAIYSPGGLGVREAVLVALLHSRMGSANALVVAAVSRLMLVLVDVILAGFGAAADRRGRVSLDAADPA